MFIESGIFVSAFRAVYCKRLLQFHEKTNFSFFSKQVWWTASTEGHYLEFSFWFPFVDDYACVQEETLGPGMLFQDIKFPLH